MTRILFAYPPSPPMLREDRCQIPAMNPVMSPPLPPMDLLYMASSAEAHGAECRVSDYSRCSGGDGQFLSDLREFRPDYLVLSITTPTLTSDLEACAIAKEAVPGLKTIAKGAHFLRFDAEVLNEFPSLDMAIYGEPELTLQEIITGKDPDDIPGLIHRTNGVVRRNIPRPFNEDLDGLPFPARHLIDNSIYRRLDNGRPQSVIRVSRGCPYHCFFCLATPVSGPKVRMRSPENIVSEIRECIDRYGIRDFVFWSDLFTHDREWVMALCSGINLSGLEIRWAANARANNADPAMAAAMRRAGCELVSMGVESGNQEMLNRMGKGTTLAQIQGAFDVFRAAGIRTLAYYLFGLPWETKETAGDTISFSVGAGSTLASFFVATPLPGTRFYDYAVEAGLMEGGNSAATGSCRDAYYLPSVDGHFLSAAEISGLQRSAVKRFFLRPSYLLRSAMGIRSFDELRRYAAAAFSVMKGQRS